MSKRASEHSRRGSAKKSPNAADVATARRETVMSSAPAELRSGDNSLAQRIRERAHAIWLLEGRPEGRSDDHWAQAEAELRDQADDSSIAETPGDAVKAFGTRS